MAKGPESSSPTYCKLVEQIKAYFCIDDAKSAYVRYNLYKDFPCLTVLGQQVSVNGPVKLVRLCDTQHKIEIMP